MFEKNKNVFVAVVITSVIAGGAGFSIGKSIGANGAGSQANGRMMGVPNGQFGQGMPGGMGRTGTGRMGGGGFVSGKIIAEDATSITVETRGAEAGQASSKIIFLSDATEVMKSVTGATADLAIGQQVTTTGTTNVDGSITAKTVQIRPDMPTPEKILAPSPTQQ